MSEVEHNDQLHAARMEISALLTGLVDVLHDTRPLPVDRQWVIPFHISCGFEGKITVEIIDLGNCPPLDAPYSAASRDEREDRLLTAMRLRRIVNDFVDDMEKE